MRLRCCNIRSPTFWAHVLPSRTHSSKPRVLVADDHALMRESVSAMLSRDFDVVAVASDGEQALAAARRTDPDVVVLDITMPGLDGFQTARALARSRTRAKVVFLSALDGDDYVAEAFASGGRGYVSKARTPFDVVTEPLQT